MTSLYSRAALSALAIAAACAMPTAAVSEVVQLKSADGTIDLKGEYVDFQDDHYIIRTALGDLRIDAARVRCEGEVCPVFETAKADLVIQGSDTVGLGLMPLLVAGYATSLDAEASIRATEREGQIIADLVGDQGNGDEIGSILVTATTSGDAFQSLLEESADIGMSSRRINRFEENALEAAGAGDMISTDQEHIVAVDSLVVITHPSNPLRQISLEQLSEIYAGEITNWSEIGGNDAPIIPINRQPGSGTRSVFESGVFLEEDPRFASDQTIAEDNSTMAALVNDDPNAIGYVGYAFQRGAKPLDLINECGMRSEPDAFSAKVEEYALQRRLFLYNREEVSEAASEFVNFALSEDADSVIAKSGFIDLGIARQRQDLNGPRARTLLETDVDTFEGGVMREMLREMVDYDRLSTTFRFRTGSSKLDERARFDMARLANFLKDQPEGTSVRFVGFTDNVGAFESNRNLSVNRAEQVISELYDVAGDRLEGIEISASGYGEVAPAACNTTDKGRAVNRRVEVWIEAAQQG